MKTANYEALMAELVEAHRQRSPLSAEMHERAKKHLVDGGSHTLRLLRPFPPRIVSAQGAWIKDEDGHDILDFWQGHLGNVLGHNPEVVAAPLAEALQSGFGLQSGFVDLLQAEVAEILCRRTGTERVRFTTSGTLANMYAVFLASAFTGRNLVMKVGGGWHGAQPWGLKGVVFDAEGGIGFQGVDTEGIPDNVTERVIVTGYNDPERLRDDLREYGDRLACFVLEPVVGAGGLVPASREYLELARELTQKHGALLIFDEVITGFRFRAGDLGALYGLQPDLAIFGKAIGGGMPVAAVAGRADIMDLTGRERGCPVNFTGGTYCAHPASLLAAKTMMSYLVAHEEEIYPRLGKLGAMARQTIETAFADEGIYARCTGHNEDVMPGSSLFFIHFPHREEADLDRPEIVADPAECDVALSRHILEAALLLEDVHLVHGHGAISTEHADADMKVLAEACRQVARRVRRFR